MTKEKKNMDKKHARAVSEKDTYGFEIERSIGIIERFDTGWTKEINLVSWNGMPAKYDIRDWDPSHTHMSHGVTLTHEQVENLLMSLRDDPDFDYLNNIN